MLIKPLTQIGLKASTSAGKASQHEVGNQRIPSLYESLGLRQSLKSSTLFISTPAKLYQTDLVHLQMSQILYSADLLSCRSPIRLGRDTNSRGRAAKTP